MKITSDLSTRFVIPPRPVYLLAIQRELRRQTPDFRKIGQLLRSDAGIASSLLRRVNSPYYGLSQPINTLEAAIVMVGTNEIDALVTTLVIRNMLGGSKILPRFWDTTEKRSLGMTYMAGQSQGFPHSFASSFGLFCDIGIPLLKEKQPDYQQTLRIANWGSESFVTVENARHGCNHAQLGAALAESWGLVDRIVTAISLHHHAGVLTQEHRSLTVRRLLAANQVVERAIAEYRYSLGYLDTYSEWEKNRAAVMELFDVTEGQIDTWLVALKERFDQASTV